MCNLKIEFIALDFGPKILIHLIVALSTSCSKGALSEIGINRDNPNNRLQWCPINYFNGRLNLLGLGFSVGMQDLGFEQQRSSRIGRTGRLAERQASDCGRIPQSEQLEFDLGVLKTN